MKRAITLICVLTLVCVGAGTWLDVTQTRTAQQYRDALPALRSALLTDRYDDAYLQQAELHARWQNDEHWLNGVISHHHTRAVNLAMVQLATAIEQQWRDEALRALDLLEDALLDVEQSDSFRLENVL